VDRRSIFCAGILHETMMGEFSSGEIAAIITVVGMVIYF
jgi:hypothetical protein